MGVSLRQATRYTLTALVLVVGKGKVSNYGDCTYTTVDNTIRCRVGWVCTDLVLDSWKRQPARTLRAGDGWVGKNFSIGCWETLLTKSALSLVSKKVRIRRVAGRKKVRRDLLKSLRIIMYQRNVNWSKNIPRGYPVGIIAGTNDRYRLDLGLN